MMPHHGKRSWVRASDGKGSAQCRSSYRDGCTEPSEISISYRQKEEKDTGILGATSISITYIQPYSVMHKISLRQTLLTLEHFLQDSFGSDSYQTPFFIIRSRLDIEAVFTQSLHGWFAQDGPQPWRGAGAGGWSIIPWCGSVRLETRCG